MRILTLGLALLIIFGVAVTFIQKDSIDINQVFNIHGRVIDSGTYEFGKSQDVFLDFQDKYYQSLKEGKKLYLVYSVGNEVQLATYNEMIYGKVNFALGQSNSNLNVIKREKFVQRIIPINNKVSFYISGEKYDFDLKEGESVYFIIEEDISKS